MAYTFPDIRPNGMSQKDLVRLLYMIVSSLKGICAKLDADGGVTDTTYEALCYTAIIKTLITDDKNNRTGTTGDHIISVTGLSDPALVQLLYELFDAFETLTEQLDADGGVTDVTYEASCYTAMFLAKVTNKTGTTLGNGTSYYFGPAPPDQAHLVDLLYNIVDSIETLTEQLDADGGVTDTDYAALWYTANVTLTIENSEGSVLGN